MRIIIGSIKFGMLAALFASACIIVPLAGVWCLLEIAFDNNKNFEV